VISGFSEIEIVGHVIAIGSNFQIVGSFVEMFKSFHGYELAVYFVLAAPSTYRHEHDLVYPLCQQACLLEAGL